MNKPPILAEPVAAQEPTGFKLVPIEPTEQMIEAFYPGGRVLQAYVGAREKADRQFSERYRAMLAAAPTPASQPAQGERQPVDRNAVLEEAAALCEGKQGYGYDAETCAAAIRDLKTQPAQVLDYLKRKDLMGSVLREEPVAAKGQRQPDDAKDAARWRWLRDKSGATDAVENLWADPRLIVEIDDAAIDAAMK
jgi:hypothetical protein